MTFTWDPTVDSDLMTVRGNTGDIISTDPLLTDEQINVALAQTNNTDQATLLCIRKILAIFGREMDRSGPRFNASRSQKFQHFTDLKAEYENLVGESAGPSWSEHSESDAEEIETDTDFVPPSFKIGRDDSP